MVYAILILAGIFAGVGVLAPAVWYASIIGVVLFALALERFAAPDWRWNLLYGAIFGLFFTATALYWWWEILPLDWAGIKVDVGHNLLSFFWLSASLWLGAFFALFAVAYKSFEGKTWWQKSFVAASLWTLIQYAQMWGFALLTLGPGSIFGAHFSAVMLGYSFAGFSPLLFLAKFGGIYLLTFIAASIGFMVYFALERFSKSSQVIIAISSMIVLACIGLTIVDHKQYLLPSKTTSPKMLEVGLITTDFHPTIAGRPDWQDTERELQMNQLFQHTSSTVSTLDLLLFPETTAYFGAHGVDARTRFEQVFEGHAPAVIDSAVTIDSSGKLKRLLLYNADATLAGTYDKIVLVPQAEYVPKLYKIPLRVIGGAQLSADMRQFADFARGSDTSPVQLGKANVGALICSDMLSPTLYAELTHNGANILINVGGDGWFHHGALSNAFILTLAKVRAVESGRYMLISSNGTPSKIVSSTGEIVGGMDRAELSLVAASVPLLSEKTLYSIVGNKILVLPLFIVILLFAASSERVRKFRKPLK